MLRHGALDENVKTTVPLGKLHLIERAARTCWCVYIYFEAPEKIIIRIRRRYARLGGGLSSRIMIMYSPRASQKHKAPSAIAPTVCIWEMGVSGGSGVSLVSRTPNKPCTGTFFKLVIWWAPICFLILLYYASYIYVKAPHFIAWWEQPLISALIWALLDFKIAPRGGYCRDSH